MVSNNCESHHCETENPSYEIQKIPNYEEKLV